jgi:hypothetical protein
MSDPERASKESSPEGESEKTAPAEDFAEVDVSAELTEEDEAVSQEYETEDEAPEEVGLRAASSKRPSGRCRGCRRHVGPASARWDRTDC